MKSERSQLQESDLLADKIEQKFAQIKPFLPALFGVIGVTVLGLLGYGIYSSQKEARAARAWSDFYFSDTSPQDLEAMITQIPAQEYGLESPPAMPTWQKPLRSGTSIARLPISTSNKPSMNTDPSQLRPMNHSPRAALSSVQPKPSKVSANEKML